MIGFGGIVSIALARDASERDEPVLWDEPSFVRFERCEQRRAAISGRRSGLVIADFSALGVAQRELLPLVARHLASSIRATDMIGWYRHGPRIGVIFTELGESMTDSEAETALLNKTMESFRRYLSPGVLDRVGLSFRMYRREEPRNIRRREIRPEDIPVSEYSNFDLLDERDFSRALHTEQRRTERSERRFVLALINVETLLKTGCSATRQAVVEALAKSIRVTDIAGWYRNGRSIGIVFTEIGDDNGKTVAKALISKFGAALSEVLTIEQINHLSLSFHVFPHDWDTDGHCALSKEVLYADEPGPRKLALRVKRIVDLLGSATGLVLLSPLFAAVAMCVKLSSKGPVFFRQQRVGQYGERFVFYKFRSMADGNDQAIHEKFVDELIANGTQAPKQGTFKIEKDPRVTRVGGFLRKTSLDELPQLLNVLKGQMSLVGPRPPIPYEVKRYDVWHRRRLLAAKPGMTGLWQVEGRSRVAFDDMVRLDLRYATNWSLGLDLKILLKTPRAVLVGEGAR